jgi:hypothetical protein
MNFWYGILGTAALALLFWIQFVGWAPTPVDQLPNAPKNIRNNPAAYRSFYAVGFHGK